MEHTKEVWNCCNKGDYGDYDGDCIVILGENFSEKIGAIFNEANARRIVACVNACAGIPTEDLENESILSMLKNQEKNMHIAEKKALVSEEHIKNLNGYIKQLEAQVKELEASQREWY